jgi:hypothetical protein
MFHTANEDCQSLNHVSHECGKMRASMIVAYLFSLTSASTLCLDHASRSNRTRMAQASTQTHVHPSLTTLSKDGRVGK